MEKTRYEILESLPAYGPMYISVAENDEAFYSEGFVVRFYKLDGTDWVANFKPGWTQLKAVYGFDNSEDILVIAGGTCYLMNAEELKPKSIFGVGYQSVIKTADGGLILQDTTDLTILEIDGELWHTERISWDGIKDLKLEGSLVSGLSFDPMHDKDEWVEFSVDLEKRNVKGGSYRRYQSKPKIHGQKTHPWWKIWLL